MAIGIEKYIAEAALQVFGSGMVLGLVALLALTILIVFLKPPGMVSAVSIGLIILTIFGDMVASTNYINGGTIPVGLGMAPVMSIGVFFIAAVLVYMAYRRIWRDF